MSISMPARICWKLKLPMQPRHDRHAGGAQRREDAADQAGRELLAFFPGQSHDVFLYRNISCGRNSPVATVATEANQKILSNSLERADRERFPHLLL
jgi:hypothetical protein